MSTAPNRSLVQRLFDEIFNQYTRSTALEIIAPGFVAHHPSFPAGIHGPEGLLQTIGIFRGAFPDLRYQVEQMVAEDGLVAARWSATGTHEGPFLHFPPSHRQFAISGMDMFRLAEGQIAEAWVNSDFLGLFLQIGAIPPFPAPPAPGAVAAG